MDRQLKERMVGAVMLIAAAIILIPPMLSGPPSKDEAGNEKTEPQTAAEDVAKLKTYTIDLAKPSAVKPTEPAPTAPPKDSPKGEEAARQGAVVSTPAPPPEESRPSAAPQTEPVKQSAESVKGRDAPTKTATPNTTSTDAAPAATAHSSGGWTVQVGSFGVKATSDRVAADLKAQGFSAFVVAFHNGNQTMYRVRIGPERDRAAAEALLRKVKQLEPHATLIPPP